MVVLIPAYEPDIKLIQLIRNIKKISNLKILIVNDGSSDLYENIFIQARNEGCLLLKHTNNLGKGAALKTGFKYLKELGEDGVVCADSDGQHLPKDILNIAAQITKNPNHIILGSRHFTGKLPFKSRLGNIVTKWIFSFITGSHIHDTQTGLRGFSSNLFDWLINLNGDRFEYEMNMLLAAENDHIEFYEIKIDTIYHQHHSTHFRAIQDSMIIYLSIFKYYFNKIKVRVFKNEKKEKII